MTVQSFAASYTVNVPGNGSIIPIANHLNHAGGNTLNNLFPSVPDGSQIFYWDCATEDFASTIPTYSSFLGQWDQNLVLEPGQGALFMNPGLTMTITFTGNPVTPTLPVVLPCGCGHSYLLGNQTASVASWETLVGTPATEGAQFIRFNVVTFEWETNTFTGCVWTTGIPSANIGESVRIYVPCPSNAPPCSCVTPPSGMSAWWTFDETSGTVANDTSGMVNNRGWLFGLPIHSGGAVAGALCFSQTNDYVLVTNHAEINFSGNCSSNAESFTIDAWIRAESNNSTLATILDKRANTGGSVGYSVYLSNGRLGCQIGDGVFNNYISTSADLRDGQWHFIAWTLARCTNNGNAGTLYVDGSIVSTFTDALIGSFSNPSDLQIGRRNPAFGTSKYYGCIDELEIFKRALTPTEILTIYGAGAAGKCKTVAVSTNCCDDCVAPFPICYTNTIYPGYNFLVNHLCHGTNNSLADILSNVPDGTTVMKWNANTQSYGSLSTYDSGLGGWVDNNGNPVTVTLSPGEGFVLNNPGATYIMIICGCLPDCPPPCLTNTAGYVLVGRLGVGSAYWTNLSSCPPVCGTIVQVWNSQTQDFTAYTYGAGGWSPSAPMVGIGQSVFVKIGTDMNCNPCTNNLVINGSFENPYIGVTNVGQLPSIPGWSSTDGASNPTTIELWSGNYGTVVAQEGYQHLEINSATYDVTVSQVITNVSTNCPARFCFWYTGRPGYVNNTFKAEVVGSGVAPVTNNPAVYTSSNSWLQYCVEFMPTSTTLIIRFTGLSGTIPAGAHIDNVMLTQCCTNTPCNDPLVVNCSTNKTVDCASVWHFDAPSASSSCCGTNITIAVFSTSTNGFCPKTATRIWQITDCLNYTATCTQTVTVVDTTAPVFATECVTNVYSAGGNTSFVTPSAAFPRPALMARLQQAWGITATRGFDECGLNQWFAHSFTNLPKCITAAYLEIRLKPCGDICGNDAMHLWFTGSANSNAVFSQYFGGGNPRAGLVTNDWCSYGNNPQTFILDLSALPVSGGGGANILPLLEANGFLDVTTQDDTGVDYVKLTVVSCCGSASKTVECGSLWFFDTPMAADDCCTNPTVTVLSTVTNGVCPKIVTRTWQATDCCSNVATASQIVTLVDNTLPVINGPGAITKYTCNNSMIVKYNVSASDACSGTLTPVCTPPSGYNFPVGTTIVTCTATDACGHVATYTFPVTIVNQSIVTSTILGINDCFKKPKENAPKSTQLLAAHPSVNWKKFDSKAVNRPFGVSFMGLPKNLTCATLDIRMKPNCSDLSENDGIGIGLATNNTTAWSSYIGGNNPSLGLTLSSWCDVGSCGQLFSLNLASMPNGGVNLLPTINALNQVDIYVQDDTAVDYAKLTYCYCRTKPWWQGWEWDLINAEAALGNPFTLVKPVVLATDYSATLAPGATHGIHVGLSPLELGPVANASFTATTHVIGDPTNADSSVKLTGDGSGKVNVSLPSLSPGVTQVKVILSLNGVVVSQTASSASSSTNAIVIMEDGPMLRAIEAYDTRVLDAQDDRITMALEAPHNIRDCPMCPPMLADRVTVVLVNPTRSPDNLLTSLTLTANGPDELAIGQTAMLLGDAWAQVGGDAEASVGDDQLTVTRQDVSSTNRIGVTLQFPLTNRVSFNLAALQNSPGTQTNGVLDVELFNIGSSGQGGVDLFNIGSSGQDGVEMIQARFAQTNGGWSISADFNALGANQEFYQVYNHGTRVASLTFHGTPHVPVLPVAMSIAESGAKLFLNWPDAQVINLNGTDYIGNELRVSAVAPDLSFGGVGRINIGCTGMDGIALASITVPVPNWWMQPLEIEGDELSIEWTGPAGGALESAPALTGPWTTVPTQSSYSATAPAPQSTNAIPAQFFRMRSN